MKSERIVYVDMDDVICAYSVAHEKVKSSQDTVEFPQSMEGFFFGLKPITGAIDVVNELRTRFDVYVLTAPSTRNPHCYTEKRLWIEQFFDYSFTKKLIISPNKGLLKGDFLIDDHVTGKGQNRFEGELIQFGSECYPDWNSVKNFLIG